MSCWSICAKGRNAKGTDASRGRCTRRTPSSQENIGAGGLLHELAEDAGRQASDGDDALHAVAGIGVAGQCIGIEAALGEGAADGDVEGIGVPVAGEAVDRLRAADVAAGEAEQEG
jgi:hypothetical protein